MDSIQLLERLDAVRTGRAVRKTSRRHIHLVEMPLVVVAYHLAGEPGAPLGFMYGTAAARPKLVVIPEPRNRDLRFQFLAQFAKDLNSYLSPFQQLIPVTTRRRNGATQTYLEALRAPQIVVPNTATASWLTNIVGRSLRYLKATGAHPVDSALPLAGAHLSFFSDRRTVPGSGLVVAATEALTLHWATPQMGVEDAALGTVLSWIDPPTGIAPVDAAARAERGAPAGPISEPEWDNYVLEPAIVEFNRLYRSGVDVVRAARGVRDDVGRALTTPWEQTWHAMSLLRAINDVAASTAERWNDDRRSWSYHVRRVNEGRAVFRRLPTALMAARTLKGAEDALESLERQMAIDDPWVMARALATGEAFEGEVTRIDLAHREQGPKKIVTRPLIYVRPFEPFLRPAGTALHLASNPKVEAEVLSSTGSEVILKVVAGMRGGANGAGSAIPRSGDRVVFSPYGKGDWYPSTLPAEIPWTHVLPVATEDSL